MDLEDEEMPVVSPATSNDLGEEDEEELDLAFEREGSVASYDSDASNESEPGQVTVVGNSLKSSKNVPLRDRIRKRSERRR